MIRRLACIVEGHGEVEALPVLVRRIASEVRPLEPPPDVSVFRVPRNKLLLHGELERYVVTACRRALPDGAVLVVLDSDDDCPAELGPELLRRSRSAASLPVTVVLAKREFEAWFLAAARSLRGSRRLAEGLESPLDPESVRGAKEWLRDHQPPEFPYSERVDQPALTARLDMAQARETSPSFDKCYREITKL